MTDCATDTWRLHVIWMIFMQTWHFTKNIASYDVRSNRTLMQEKKYTFLSPHLSLFIFVSLQRCEQNLEILKCHLHHSTRCKIVLWMIMTLSVENIHFEICLCRLLLQWHPLFACPRNTKLGVHVSCNRTKCTVKEPQHCI